jgi:microsomal dipeptidase-like Zn-dependent dipeptidase
MPDAARPTLTIDALECGFPSRENFEQWRQGGIDCVHHTVVLPHHNARDTFLGFDRWRQAFLENADLITPATSAREISAAKAAGKTAVIMGFQNTVPLEDSLDLLDTFWALGLRVMQLTYNTQNSAAGGCWDETDAGVTQVFGRNLIKRMNELGILVDLSHSGDRTCLDAIDISEKPVAITHGNPYSLVGAEVELPRRNRSDEVLRAVARTGGVIGLCSYLRITPHGEDCTLADFCEMAARTAELVGAEHIGIGTDHSHAMDNDDLAFCRSGRFSRVLPVPIGDRPSQPAWLPSPAAFHVFSLFSEVFPDPIVGAAVLTPGAIPVSVAVAGDR